MCATQCSTAQCRAVLCSCCSTVSCSTAHSVNAALGIAIPELIVRIPPGLAQYSLGLHYHCLRTWTSEF